MAQANIQINIEDASVNELNQEIARLNDELENTSRSTEEGRKKIKALGQDINKLQSEVQGVEQSFAEVDIGAFVGEVGKVAAGLGAAGLALSSFGSENEQVAEILEKTNAILALAATAEAIYTVTQKESQIALAAKQAGTLAAAAAQTAYTAVIGTSTGALKLFRLALVSTGIGAIVVAVGLLIANWDKLTSAVTNFVEKSEGLTKLFDFIRNIIPAVTGAIKAFFTQFTQIAGSVGKILKGIFTLDLNAIKEGVSQATSILKEGAAAGVREAEQARREAQELENRKNKQELLDYEADRLAIVSDNEEEIFRAKQKAARNSLRATQLEFGKDSEEYRKAYLDLLKLQEDFNDKQEAERKKSAEERRKKRKEANAALLKAQADYEKKRLSIFELSAEEQFQAIDENLKNELRTIKSSAKSKAEVSTASATAELDALAAKAKIIEQQQKTELENAKIAFEQKVELLKAEAALVGDTDRVLELEQEAQAYATIYNNQVQAITEATQTQLAQLKILDDDQKRVVTESLGRVAKVNEEFTTEVAKTQKDAFDDILNTGIAAALDATADRVELRLRDIEVTYTDVQQDILNESRKAVFEEIALRLQQLNSDKAIVQQRIATIEKLLKSEELAGEARKELEKELIELKKESLDLDEEIKTTSEETGEAIKEFIGEDLAATLQASFDLLSASLDFLNEKINATTAEYDRAAKAAEDYYDRQIAAAGNNAARVEELEEQKNQKLESLEAQKNQKVKDLQIKAANVQFALAIGQITANTAVAIMKALAELGPIAGPVAAGLIGTTGLIQLATANQARLAAISSANSLTGSGSINADSTGGRTQFAEGGYVSGPGTGTSDSINARLSNGEYVINANSTARYLPLLEQINSAGRGFANGGMASNGPDLTDVLMRIEKRLATPPKAYVVSTEIQQGLDTQEYLERRAQLT